MPIARIPPLLLPALGLLLLARAGAVRAADPVSAPVTRWYESFAQRQKTGWTQVTWSVSTWKGRPTVHDHTEIVSRTVRDMAGHKDTFESRTVVDLERDDDGTLWWQKVETVEAGRRSWEELTWTGSGYDSVEAVDEQEKRVSVPLDAPVSTDAEAFLSRRARQGALAQGLALSLRELDLRARRARERSIEVLGPEEVQGEAGPVLAVKVVVRQPETGAEDWMWMDADGAFVRSLNDTGAEQRRVPEAQARAQPQRAASFGITAPSVPPLERVMSADRLWVDVQLASDADRKLPSFPASPWSTAGAPVAQGDGGWRIPVVLTGYDDPEAHATLPIPPQGFEQELESTPLMPCGHPDLAAAVKEAAGGETDARTVATRLSRWVHDALIKGSPDVAEASALQILAERKGDCSEHALLFTALCRTAGIPARRCTGWTNIGSDWGAHAWSEIWVGAWIGADPTTGEVGTRARYLFFGYPDDPASHPQVVSARISQRLSLTVTRVEEDGVGFDLEPAVEGNVREGGEGAARWWLHVTTGIEARGLSEGWTVRLLKGGEGVLVRGPGITASVEAQADQGLRLDGIASADHTTFAGAPALSFEEGLGRRWVVQSRRRLVQVRTRTQDAERIARLERILAPTFARRVTDPATAPAVPEPDVPAAPAAGPGDTVTPDVFVGAWALDLEGTRERLRERLLEGLDDEARARIEQRIEHLVERVAVDLHLAADGGFVLAFARDDPQRPDQPPARTLARGRWTLDAAGLVLRASEPVEGDDHGRVEALEHGTRLRLSWGAWPLLLQRGE